MRRLRGGGGGIGGVGGVLRGGVVVVGIVVRIVVRVVVAVGDDIAEAAKRAYDGVDAIVWPGGFVRRDIGWRAIARDEKKK